MNVGDLVKKQNEWAEWVEHNPWMALRSDDTVGIVVAVHEGTWPKDWDVNDLSLIHI